MEIRIVDSEKYDAEKQKEVERETFALIRLRGRKGTHLLWLFMIVVVVAVNRPSLSMIFVIIKRIGVVSFDFCSIVTQ